MKTNENGFNTNMLKSRLETLEFFEKNEEWKELIIYEVVPRLWEEGMVLINHGNAFHSTDNPENMKEFVAEALDANNLSICGTDLNTKILYVTRLNFDVEVDNFNDENHVVKKQDFLNLFNEIHNKYAKINFDD